MQRRPWESIKIIRQDIKRLLKGLHPHKMYVSDDVSPYVLKERVQKVFLGCLKCNKSMEEGSVVRGWKRAHIPVFKK